MIKIKYDFKCSKCGVIEEVYMGTTQFSETICDKCGGKMVRIFPTPEIPKVPQKVRGKIY